MRRILAVAMLLALAGCGKDNNPTAPTVPLPFKNVHDYGAKGDGTADDTAAINAALVGGGDVYVPTGIYRVLSAIQVSVPTTLRGAGRGLSSIRIGTAGPGTTIAVSSSNVTITGLSIEGPTAADTYTANETGLTFLPPSGASFLRDIVVRDCEVFNYGFHGLELDHVQRATLSGIAAKLTWAVRDLRLWQST